jgi:hypothetical protein
MVPMRADSAPAIPVTAPAAFITNPSNRDDTIGQPVPPVPFHPSPQLVQQLRSLQTPWGPAPIQATASVPTTTTYQLPTRHNAPTTPCMDTTAIHLIEQAPTHL